MRRWLGVMVAVAAMAWAASAGAACSGSSPLRTAASPANGDIQDCITAAVTGDIIQIPAGAATWTGNVTLNKAVTLVGATTGCPTACVDNTIITTTTAYQLLVQASNARVSGLTFTGQANAYGYVYVNRSGFVTSNTRIDHNHFINYTVGTAGRAITHGAYASAAGYLKDYPALIDNNRFTATGTRGKAIEVYGHSATAHGSWDDPLALGGDDFLFIEDNIFEAATMPDGVSGIDGDTNAKFVVRFNTFTNTDVFCHGQETCTAATGVCAYRSTRAWEIYANTFSFTTAHTFTMNMRGGTGYMWGNTFSGTGGPTAYRYLYERGDLTRTCLLANACQGLYAADGNQPGQWGYPCYMQHGMTGSTGIVPLPIRHWLNTAWGSTQESAMVIVAWESGCNYQHVQVGRDVLLTERSGVGTTLPASCATGAAYWKTNEGYWNTANDSPTVTPDGVLYTCAAPNTWTLYYVPYLYPHPLRGGLGAPTGLVGQ